MRKLGTIVFIAVLTVAGGAFAQMGPFVSDNLATLKAQTPTGSAFNQALHKEYAVVGEEALNESDHQHADRYIRKGFAAGNGAEVLPENPRTWIVPARASGELNEWHGKLLKALDFRNNRARKPAASARAQVMFDCWVEEEHEDIWLRQPGKQVYQPEDIARCKNAFLAAYNELLQEGRFSVYHRFNRWRQADLAPAEGTKLANAVAAAQASGGRVNINGNTDTVGSASYNLGLSKRRANMVKDAMVRAGIPPSRIVATGFGFTRLAVPTGPGVRNQLNRRSEIIIE